MGGHRGLLFFFSFTLFPFVAVPVPSHVPISYFVNSTKSRMNLFRLNDKIDLGPAISSVCHRRSFGLMKPPRSKLRGITRKGIVCETPRFLKLFPLQGNLAASSEESPDSIYFRSSVH